MSSCHLCVNSSGCKCKITYSDRTTVCYLRRNAVRRSLKSPFNFSPFCISTLLSRMKRNFSPFLLLLLLSLFVLLPVSSFLFIFRCSYIFCFLGVMNAMWLVPDHLEKSHRVTFLVTPHSKCCSHFRPPL